MKTTRLLLTAALCASAFIFAGCTNLPKLVKLQQEIDRLGIDEIRIPGRATHTSYKRTIKDGQVSYELEHNNPWLSAPAVLKGHRPATSGEAEVTQ